MSREESKDYSLRELIRQNIELMQQHKMESDRFRENTTRQLAAIETHNSYSQEKIKENTKDIEDLKSAHNIQKGFLAALSAIGLTFIADLIRRIAQ